MEHFQTVVFIIRHGETDFGYSRDSSRDAVRRLTDLGKKQTVAVGKYLANFPITRIYSSRLERCLETAEIIKKAIDLKAEIEKEKKLAEIYPDEKHPSALKRGETVLLDIVKQHFGEQIVAVSHQVIIGEIVADFFNQNYSEVTCSYASVYRLVFADDKLVEITYLEPARSILKKKGENG